MYDLPYTIYVDGQHPDSVKYSIRTIPDLYPAISVEIVPDSADRKVVYFLGTIQDDYGLSRLTFNYRKKGADGTEFPMEIVELMKPSGKFSEYAHILDSRELGMGPAEELTYYFEVFDNDAVNGSKSSRTTLMTFKRESLEEIEKRVEDNTEDIIRSRGRRLPEPGSVAGASGMNGDSDV